MTAIDFDTYADYVKARSAQGFQVLPSSLWKALKENKPDLVTRRVSSPAYT